MKYYRSLRVLFAISFLVLCSYLGAENTTEIARGGEGARVHHHPEAGRHINHPAARAYGRGYAAGEAVGGAAGGGVVEPVYYAPTDGGTTVTQPVSQPAVVVPASQ